MEEKKKKTVGILVIALGRYTAFWPELYKSCEKFFLPNYKKEYYVFTDTLNLKYGNEINVFSIPQKKLGWPYDTLMRFDMFLSQKQRLEKCDYLYFLNINLICKSKIGEEIIPTEENDNLMVCSHPGYFDKPRKMFPYEQNKNCSAYIPATEGKHYAPGGFNGGTSSAFLELAKTCSKNIHADFQKNIIATWHDESHLNKYITDKNPLIMPLNYMYPTNYKLLEKNNTYSKNIKMELRSKVKYGGHYYLRGACDIKNSIWNKLKYKVLFFFANNNIKQEKYYKILRMLYYEY